VIYPHLKTLRYNLPAVDSADVTAWAATMPADGSQELYVEIKLDRTIVNATKAVERNGIVFWDEDVLLYV
jgi:hypothetical protein